MAKQLNLSKQFDIKANLPLLWEKKGDELLTSAKLLWERWPIDKGHEVNATVSQDAPERSIVSVFLMLRAMALECLLKAVWLRAGKKLAISGKYIKIPDTNDHKLETLAAKLAKENILKFDADEITFLTRLSLYNTGGRYPVFKDFNVTGPEIGISPAGIKHLGPELAFVWPTDNEKFALLLKRIDGYLTSKNSPKLKI